MVNHRQTVELPSPDGSASAHLLLAGIVLAVDWGFSNPESTDLARKLYVTGNVFKNYERLSQLSGSASLCPSKVPTKPGSP